MSRGTHERFRTWIFGTVVEWFYNYTRQAARIDDSKILEFLIYKTDMTEVATTSSETTPNRPDAALEVNNISHIILFAIKIIQQSNKLFLINEIFHLIINKYF